MTARRLLEHLGRALPPARRGIAVLAYHLVGAGTDSPVDLPREVFRAQMRLLAERFTVLPLERALVDTGPAVVLTFDDAYENFRQVAWPILSELGLPATLYVPVDFVEGRGLPPIRGAGLAACSWEDLRELRREGLEIGSHSISHTNLTDLPPDAVERELGESRRILEDRLGCAVESFCYPRAKWNPRVARQAGAHYRTAVVAGGRRVHPSTVDRSHVPRFPVRRDVFDFGLLAESRLWLPEAAADWIRQWMP